MPTSEYWDYFRYKKRTEPNIKRPANNDAWNELVQAEIAGGGNAGGVAAPAPAVNAPQTSRDREASNHDDILDYRWYGGGEIGDGRNPAGVWVRFDENDEIVDRVVVKDTYLDPAQWADVRKWEVRSPKHRVMRPMEYGVQQRLRNTGDHRHFAGVRKCKVFVKRRMYRLYTDYCSYGNGAALIEGYRKRFREPLPEHCLWCMLSGLADAALVMEQGSVTAPVPGWSQVVHRDIKPDNIFFGRATAGCASSPSGEAAGRLVPMLGDFGSAMLTHPLDLENPDLYREDANANGEAAWNAADGFRAPETDSMFEVPEHHFDVEEKILSACNIWAIGRTMIAFMELKYGGGEVDTEGFDFFSFDEEERSPTVQDETALEFYSDKLVDIVQQCCRYQPVERPTAAQLREVARTYIADNEVEMALVQNDISYTKDMYAIGVHRAELERRDRRRSKKRSGVDPSVSSSRHGRSSLLATTDGQSQGPGPAALPDTASSRRSDALQGPSGRPSCPQQ